MKFLYQPEVGFRLFQGIQILTLDVFDERELKAIEGESLAYTAANTKAIQVSAAFIPIIRMAILAGFLATLVVGGKMALEGAITVGSFSVLVFLTQRLLWPLTGLAETVDLYQRAMASTARVLDLLETPPSQSVLFSLDGDYLYYERTPHANIGVEYSAMRMYHLRLGYQIHRDVAGLTFGFGLARYLEAIALAPPVLMSVTWVASMTDRGAPVCGLIRTRRAMTVLMP